MTDQPPASGGLRFNRHQRAHMVGGRTLIQAPTEADAEVVAANARMKHQTVEGIPFDVRMTLQALRDLAEQGNLVARRVYEVEAEKWGLRPDLLLLSG